MRKRVTKNTVKDRLADLKNIAKRLRFLAIEVILSRFAVSCLSQFISKNACCFFTTRTVCKCLCSHMAASEHSARCVFVDAEWREACGLHQDSSILRPVLTGGGGEG